MAKGKDLKKESFFCRHCSFTYPPPSPTLTPAAPHTHHCAISPPLSVAFRPFSLVTMERVLFPFPPPEEEERPGGGVVAGAHYSRLHTPLGRRQVFLTQTGDGAGGGFEGGSRRLYGMPSPLLPAGPASAAFTCSHSRLNSHIYHRYARGRRLRCVEKDQNVWESRTSVASGAAGSCWYMRPTTANPSLQVSALH